MPNKQSADQLMSVATTCLLGCEYLKKFEKNEK